MAKTKKQLMAINNRESNRVPSTTPQEVKEYTPMDINDKIKHETALVISSAINENDLEKKKQLYKIFETNVSILKSIKCHDLEEMLLNNLIARISKNPGEISNKELMDAINLSRNLINKNNEVVNDANSNIQLTQNNTEVNINVEPQMSRESREKVADVVNAILKQIQKPQVGIQEGDVIDLTKGDINNG